jgi:hypothetical protein
MRVLPLVLVLGFGGCATAPAGSPAPDAAVSIAVGSLAPSSSASPVQRPSLPADFPVMPGAGPAPIPDDDPGLIALWEGDQPGSEAYDFYAAALPAAGYRIVGLYPGDEVALIRFAIPSGEIWQVVVRPAAGNRIATEVRLDRP